jgi:trigger factor
VQVSVEKLAPCQVKVSFTVPSAEFHGAIRRALTDAGRNVRMKGFRPGHVPTKVIERQYGEQVRREAMEHFTRQAFEQAVRENELKVVGFQRINVAERSVLEGVDFNHEFEVSLRPEIDLKEYKGLEVESQLEPVMDPEIDNALENLKREQATPEPAGEAGLPLEGLAVTKIEWVADGEVVLSRDDMRISPQTPTPGTEPEAFQAALLGARDGDVREVAMKFPDEFAEERLRGKTGTTRIHVNQAFRMIPPTDQDLQKLLGVEDDAALRRMVREKMEEAKREQENHRVENAIIDQILTAHEFDLPGRMIDEQTNLRLANVKKQLAEQGTPPDKVEAEAESQRDAMRNTATTGMRALFMLQAIADREKLLVSREDMQSELQKIAERNQAPLEEVAEYYKKNNLYEQMAIEILDRKVRRFLRENAKIKEPT